MNRASSIATTILIALFGCIVYALGAMSRVAVPAMAFDAIRDDYGFSPAQIAMLPSVGVLGCLFSIGIAGVMVDRFGWARLMLIGSLIQAIGYWPVHESQSLPFMLAGEFVNGVGRTTVYLSILKLFDVTFERKYFAALIGIFYFFSYGGTLGASTIFPWLTNHCGTWQLAARAINTVTVICGAAIAIGVFGVTAKRSETTRSVFPWKDLRAFTDLRALSALIVGGLVIAIYWSFLTVAGAPFAKTVIKHPEFVTVMNTIVMVEMIFMGLVSLIFGNARRPFFIISTVSLACGFAALLAGLHLYGYILIGVGYGMTVILLTGVKERVPIAFAASAIGFTNTFANITQVCTNQTSGFLMRSNTGYQTIFVTFLVLSLIALMAAIYVAIKPAPSSAN